MMGERIKELRKQRGLTQEGLATALNKEYGLSIERSMVSKWENGFQSPVIYTLSCIAKFFGVSMDYLTKGKRSPIVPVVDASYSLHPPARRRILVPVLGEVPAGIPIEAVEDILDYEEISADMAIQGEYFGLRVIGDSMEPKFSEGDVVIVRKQDYAENGDIAIVMVNGSAATVKKFYKSEVGISLISTNPAYAPMTFSPREVNELPVRVIGKVVELRAKF